MPWSPMCLYCRQTHNTHRCKHTLKEQFLKIQLSEIFPSTFSYLLWCYLSIHQTTPMRIKLCRSTWLLFVNLQTIFLSITWNIVTVVSVMGRVYFKGTAQIQNALSLSVILVIIWLLKYKTIYVQKKNPSFSF